jgi:hypothetical protein
MMLLRLWREWHKGEPVQLQLPLEWIAKDVEASSVRRLKRTQTTLSPAWLKGTSQLFSAKNEDIR